ncbi:MAG: hypothetical protein JSV32_07310 [Dehalococcoidia bacterium]|nr:MAG: hypothetical protein JSV32_07310 [Dehalococcoidia bacterium]
MIGLDHLILENILETKMAKINNETGNKELIPIICNAIAETIKKSNRQIEMDFSAEPEQHGCT